MFFLHPLALLGLAAVLVPPLLHLFQRRRPPEVIFPAMRYLRQTEREAQRTIRLRHLLLMLLRMLAVALLVTAAARPVIPGGAGVLHDPTALALVLDNSVSSGAIAGGRRVLDDLAARARETLRAAQAGDAVWLIAADGLARRGTPAELIEASAALRPDPRRLDLGASVGAAARLIATSGYARGEIHVLSDLQATALGGGATPAGRATGAGPGAGSREPERPDSAAAGLPVLFYHPAADPPENRGVIFASPSPPVWLAGTGGVVARVGGGPAGAGGGRVAVSLTLEGRAGARALAAAGEAITLGAPSATPGWRGGEVGLEADELRADDGRPFAVRVVPPATVAVAAGADPGPFLAAALTVLAEGGQVRRAGAGAGADAVLIGTPSRTGASVVLPPADPVALGAANRALAAAGVRWRFGARVDREDSIAAPDVPELSGARVLRRYRLTETPAGAGRGVLARAGGEPWLVRDGRVVLVASRLVPEETTLPVSGGFVPFVGALVNRLARGEAGVIEAAPGDPVALPPDVTALVLAADSAPVVESGSVIAAPAAPGLYRLLAGRDTVGMLVVALDPRESDLTRASASLLATRFPGARVSVTGDARAYGAQRFRGAGRSELTGGLLALLLLVLLAEAGLATGGFARRAAA